MLYTSIKNKIIPKLDQLLYTAILLETFDCFCKGTIHCQTMLLVDITIIMHPRFIKGKTYQELYDSFNKILRMKNQKIKYKEHYETDFEKKLREIKDQIPDSAYTTINKYIQKFIKKSEEKYKYELEQYYDKNLIAEDILQRRFNVFNSHEVFTFDTTQRGDIFITMLIDFGTRVIVKYLITKSEPTPSQLVNFLKEYFVSISDFNTTGILLHGDQAGANTCKELREFCYEFGITLSFCNKTKVTGNEVSECTNRILWKTVSKFKIADKPDRDFNDLEFSEKKDIIIYSIHFINNRINSSSPVLLKYSPLEMEKIKKYMRSNSMAFDKIKPHLEI